MASKYQIVFSLQVGKIRIVMLLQEERVCAYINNFDTVRVTPLSHRCY